ncbi:MAG: hypothetical protein F4123_12595 [Gemmatimonadetes bacterium]|nr:hypothetical protein [Gemmatimonadota bacterium]MYB97141.1 hypothetical protein [Gemmatimonadota bacterium]MYI47194.1 hypothetical protein [Gemmatimonadota bacterium]
MNRPASMGLALASILWMAACSEPNQAPFSCGPISPQTVDMGDTTSFLSCFTDPDADPLTVSAEVANHLRPYVAVSVDGPAVTIHGTREHPLLPVTVTATDPDGLYAVEEVDVTIRGLHDLAVLDAWPDSQTVSYGRFALYSRVANIGKTAAKVATWTVRLSSDSVITTDDPVYWVAFIGHDLAPGDGGEMQAAFTNHPHPGTPYFGWCGESQTPEYNLANNCSKALKVIFPDETAARADHSSSSRSPEVVVDWRERVSNSRRE